jgi:hypothetical protein
MTEARDRKDDIQAAIADNDKELSRFKVTVSTQTNIVGACCGVASSWSMLSVVLFCSKTNGLLH